MNDPFGASGTPAETLLAPLVALADVVAVDCLVAFGSRAGPGEHGADLDAHLVVDRVDRRVYELVAGAAALAARRAGARDGCAWQLELRHGPFKPRPGAGAPRQLHLVLDDRASIARTSCAIRLRRLAGGLVLSGAPVLPEASCAPPRRVAEARRELERWRTALLTRRIPFRRWRLEPAARLCDERAAARDAWELSCLLRAASVSARLHLLAAASATAGGGPLAGEVPLVAQTAWRRDWQDLPARWPAVAGAAVEQLDRWLGELAGQPAPH